MALPSSADPQVPQEGLPGDAFRSSLLCPQPQALGQSILQVEMDCELHSSLQVCERSHWAAPGVGAWLVPGGGGGPCTGSHGAPGSLVLSVLCSPCSSPWMPTAMECSGTARPPPAACWRQASARRSGRAQAWRRGRRLRGPCPAAQAGGTRWPKSPPSPRVPLHVSVAVGRRTPVSGSVVRATRG